MAEPLAYLNGSLIPQCEAQLQLNDAGVVFGATVTDLCRTFQHQLFRLPEHLQRFRKSCELAYVPLAATDEQLTQAAEQIVGHNSQLIEPKQDLALVLIATPGPIGYYLAQPGSGLKNEVGDSAFSGMPTAPGIDAISPSPPASGGEGWGEGGRSASRHLVHSRATSPLTPNPSPQRGEGSKAQQERDDRDIGLSSAQPGSPGDGGPTICLHTFPIPFTRYTRLFHEGARLVIPPTRQVPSACIDPHIKQRSRLHWWLAEHEARQVDPVAFALLQDIDGYVTETAFANVLIVRQGKVISPPRSTILDGISLGVTEGLCREFGIPFSESLLTIQDCQSADEAMLTGTMFCLAGVRSINGTLLAWPGPVTSALANAWSQHVGLDYRAQILAL